MCCAKKTSLTFPVNFICFAGVILTITGTVQIATGVLFTFFIHVFTTGSNIGIGIANILFGCTISSLIKRGIPKKWKFQVNIGLATSVLVFNLGNILVLEIGEWRYWEPTKEAQYLAQENPKLITAAYISTTVSTGLAMLIAVFDLEYIGYLLATNGLKFPEKSSKFNSSGTSRETRISHSPLFDWVFPDSHVISETPSESSFTYKKPANSRLSDSISLLGSLYNFDETGGGANRTSKPFAKNNNECEKPWMDAPSYDECTNSPKKRLSSFTADDDFNWLMRSRDYIPPKGSTFRNKDLYSGLNDKNASNEIKENSTTLKSSLSCHVIVSPPMNEEEKATVEHESNRVHYKKNFVSSSFITDTKESEPSERHQQDAKYPKCWKNSASTYFENPEQLEAASKLAQVFCSSARNGNTATDPDKKKCLTKAISQQLCRNSYNVNTDGQFESASLITNLVAQDVGIQVEKVNTTTSTSRVGMNDVSTQINNSVSDESLNEWRKANGTSNILSPESLVPLSRLELLARHWRISSQHKELHRKISKRLSSTNSPHG